MSQSQSRRGSYRFIQFLGVLALLVPVAAAAQIPLAPNTQVPLPPKAYEIAADHLKKGKLGTIFGGKNEIGIKIEELLGTTISSSKPTQTI